MAAVQERDVRVLPRATAEWFTAMATLQNHTDAQARTYRRIVGQLAIPAGFAMLADDRDIVSLAYGALHNGLLCYESVVTDRRRRRSGFARRVITGLAAWAKEHGASGACLEVEAGNAAARALYQDIGLTAELYRYHYRREPRPASGTH
jgi:ribosomal protein S18 acetylase RimI-like enzyme